MKEEFYCLPLKKKVTAKIKRIVRKGNRYSLKSTTKKGDKEYNLTKTCGKARAEEVSAATGIDIEEIKAAEQDTVVPADSFVPEGTGNVIGQNTAATQTAIEATESTPTANTTPFRSESPDPEDKIGPMSMAAESPRDGSDILDAFAGPAIEKMIEEDDSDYEIDDYLLLIDGKIREGSGNTEMDVIEKEKPDSYHIVKIIGVKPYKIKTVDFGAEEKKNCGCGQDPCKTYGADGYEKSRSKSDDDDEDVIEGALEDEEANDVPQGFDPTDQDAVQFDDGNIMSPTKMESEGGGGVGYAIEPDHWMRLQAHPEWQGTREEVNVERENNFWVITASSETADDLLELILETSDVETSAMDTVGSTGINTGLTLGIGVLGIAASIMLLRRFNKE